MPSVSGEWIPPGMDGINQHSEIEGG